MTDVTADSCPLVLHVAHLVMRTAGVREARQNLSALLDEVKKGREIVITEHGRPVAKLVPPDPPRGKNKGIPDFAAIRRKMPVFDPPLSTTLDEDRADRF
jgi:prevent-host-death family protein